MKRHVLIINGNPDCAPERLSSALCDAYRQGAEAAGCTVRRIDVGNLHFSLLRDAGRFSAAPQDQAIIDSQDAFLAADHLVFIFPLWLAAPPALFKAFMEQLACGEFLLGAQKRGFPSGKLKGKSARVIVTMGMPALAYRWLFGAQGVKAFNRGILGLSGVGPVKTSYFGGGDIQPPRSAAIVKKIRDLGRRVA